jgi:hypothetical protein
LASGHTGNVVPGNRLWVRIPCPPLTRFAVDLTRWRRFFCAVRLMTMSLSVHVPRPDPRIRRTQSLLWQRRPGLNISGRHLERVSLLARLQCRGIQIRRLMRFDFALHTSSRPCRASSNHHRPDKGRVWLSVPVASLQRQLATPPSPKNLRPGAREPAVKLSPAHRRHVRHRKLRGIRQNRARSS